MTRHSSANPFKDRYVMTPCHGRNPRTGRQVGSRHRWEGITCKWCGRFKDMCRVKIKR